MTEKMLTLAQAREALLNGGWATRGHTDVMLMCGYHVKLTRTRSKLTLSLLKECDPSDWTAGAVVLGYARISQSGAVLELPGLANDAGFTYDIPGTDTGAVLHTTMLQLLKAASKDWLS